jgi:hypothetical protein
MAFENITSQVANIQVGESFRGRIVNVLGCRCHRAIHGTFGTEDGPHVLEPEM